ncbi:MAG: adenylate/guanylate cyclase domain-containing protein, partial [Planctomycetota bacterium]
SLILYFLAILAIPMGIVTWQFATLFEMQAQETLENTKNNILVQAKKNLHLLLEKAHHLCEYNNDIFKLQTIDIENPNEYPRICEFLKSGVINTPGVKNVGVVSLKNRRFFMAFQDHQGNLVVKETKQVGNQIWSRFWRDRVLAQQKTSFTPWKKDNFNVITRPWYIRALQSKSESDYEVAWTQPYIFKESKEVGITAAKAVNLPGKGLKKPFAIVFVDISLKGLTSQLQKLRLQGGTILLASPEGKVLASSQKKFYSFIHSHGGKLPFIYKMHLPFLSKILWEKKILPFLKHPPLLSGIPTLSYHMDNREYLCSFDKLYLPIDLSTGLTPNHKLNTSFYLMIFTSPDTLLASYYASMRTNYILTFCIALAALFISLYLWKKITGPLCDLVKAFQKLELGNLNAEVQNEKTYEEIHSLTESFNKMVHSLREKGIMEKLISKSAKENIRQQVHEKKEYASSQRKTLTLLFSDIRGFTPFSEEHPPEEVVDILNKYLNIQAKIIEENGGDIDKFIGDEVMAIFNTNEGLEKALHSALKIIRKIEELNALEGQKESIHVGIGIHMGEVVAGYMGSEGRADYTVIGDTVNYAARLCSSAGGGEIWVSQEVKDAMEGSFAFEFLGEIAFKGKKTLQRVYRLLDQKEIR